MQIQFSGTCTLLEYLYLMLSKLKLQIHCSSLNTLLTGQFSPVEDLSHLRLNIIFLYMNNTDSNNQKIK